jgi:leucyl aminopeptidase (aminopeptidase T)
MTVNQEHAALYLAQRRRELEQQQLLLLQQLQQQQQLLQLPAMTSVAEAQQISFAKNAAMLQQIQQMQMQHVQIQQQLASAQQPLESPQRNEVDTQKKKSSYDDLGMIIETPDDERQQQQY